MKALLLSLKPIGIGVVAGLATFTCAVMVPGWSAKPVVAMEHQLPSAHATMPLGSEADSAKVKSARPVEVPTTHREQALAAEQATHYGLHAAPGAPVQGLWQARLTQSLQRQAELDAEMAAPKQQLLQDTLTPEGSEGLFKQLLQAIEALPKRSYCYSEPEPGLSFHSVEPVYCKPTAEQIDALSQWFLRARNPLPSPDARWAEEETFPLHLEREPPEKIWTPEQTERLMLQLQQALDWQYADEDRTSNNHPNK